MEGLEGNLRWISVNCSYYCHGSHLFPGRQLSISSRSSLHTAYRSHGWERGSCYWNIGDLYSDWCFWSHRFRWRSGWPLFPLFCKLPLPQLKWFADNLKGQCPFPFSFLPFWNKTLKIRIFKGNLHTDKTRKWLDVLWRMHKFRKILRKS